MRADRQPEFTQVDIELSFVDAGDIKRLVEGLLASLFNLGEDFTMETMDYAEAMEKYGCDKPDMRFGLTHSVVTDIFGDSSFGIFSRTAATPRGMIKALFVPRSEGTFSRKQTDSLSEMLRNQGGGGAAFFKVEGGKRSGGISKFITDEDYQLLEKRTQVQGEGTWFFVASDKEEVCHACADMLRRQIGKQLGLIKKGYSIVWIDGFPLLQWEEKEGRLTAVHHPFCAPLGEAETFLEASTQTASTLKAASYDVVCNGHEIGGGSVRIQDPRMQRKMFSLLGLSEKEIEEQFGFFLKALGHGTPPHAGVALGFDRIVMLLAGSESLRDVVAFPKTAAGRDPMLLAPSPLSGEQLREVHLGLG